MSESINPKTKPGKKPTVIEARSIVSGRNLEPYIQIFILYDDGSEDQVTQWSTEEAYHQD